jgi:predicted Fe-Mo cluster-binding NifX family protein
MPVKSDQGVDSLVYDHFGSAPCFIVVDAETNQIQTIPNKNEDHEHGDCQPLMSFQDTIPDIVVVGGIGGGALTKLNHAGVRVFKSEGLTVKENIELLTTKGLIEFTSQHTCHGHSHGESCSH